MALLIDGYNLLHVTDIFAADGPGTELHRARLALLEFLASAISERERRATAIVFDAAGAPPGLPQRMTHARMTVHFARQHADADELIEELLEQHRAPKSLTVVSSDHRVQRAARHVGAAYADSEQWYSEMRTALRAATARDASAKPSGEVSPDERDYWVRKFNDAPADGGDSAHPFPPGYAEDVGDAESS